MGETMSVFKEDVLNGRVALITGGGTGICKGIAQTYAKHGAKVAITSRKLENLEATAQEIEAAGGQCLPITADVRNTEQVEAAVKAVVDKWGRLDTVINGAAGNFLCPAAQLSYNAFKTVVDIDLIGTFNMSKATFDELMKAGQAGNDALIINITATLHYVGTPMQAHVSAAKAGIDALTKNLAVEWGPLGIRVNSIAPGPIGDTEGMKRLAPGDLTEKLAEKIPLRRFGRIQEIADMSLFLATPAARYITGAHLVVDGGHWLAGQTMGL
jgi:2,4-dienoyl-CoA reductase [(3E)-enoyl-CoA-producing], peroxisomal